MGGMKTVDGEMMPVNGYVKRQEHVSPQKTKGHVGDASASLERLKRACQEFEAIFIQELLKGLRRTAFESTNAEKSIYEGMFDEQISRVCAKRGLGLAELLLAKLRHEMDDT